MSTPAPWERQPQESGRAFEAFAHYRDMGARRSLDKVREKVGKAPAYVRQLERWSSQHAWVERAAAWDAEQDRIAREQVAQEVRRMRERQIEAAMEQQEALRLPARILLNRLKDIEADPTKSAELDAIPLEDLVKLVATASRSMKTPAALEWIARGFTAEALAALGAGERDAGEVVEQEDSIVEELRRAATLVAVAEDLTDPDDDAGGEDEDLDEEADESKPDDVADEDDVDVLEEDA